MAFDERQAYMRVEEELMPGEALLWVGRPVTPFGALASRTPVVSIVAVLAFMIALGIFLWFFPVVRAATAMPVMFVSPMWIPMILMFLLMLLVLVASPIGRLLNARHTTYAITSRRILILDGIFTPKVTSYGPDDIERIERRSYSGGRGDIIFRYEPRAYRSRRGNWWHTQYTSEPIGFFGIPNVREVEQLLIETFMPGGETYPKAKRKHGEALEEEVTDDYPMEEVDLSDLLPGRDADRPPDSTHS